MVAGVVHSDGDRSGSTTVLISAWKSTKSLAAGANVIKILASAKRSSGLVGGVVVTMPIV